MEKKVLKRRKTFVIFLIGFVIGIIGFAISFVMYLKSDTKVFQKDDNKQNTHNNNDNNDKPKDVVLGDIVFSSIDSSLHLDKAIPTLDKFGVLSDPFNFAIKNTSREAKNYSLKLVDDNSTIPNKEIRYELIKNDKSLGIYTLSTDGVIDIAQIKSLEEIKYSIKIWLDYNSDIEVGTFNKKIAVAVETVGIDEEFVNKPVLLNNMIPVIYDNETNSWLKSDNKNTYSNEWYNYSKQKWANVVTVTQETRNNYINSPVGTKIELDDINAFFVWIPRFTYSSFGSDIKIEFVDSTKEAYSAFKFNDNNIDGFWISKFESGLKVDSKCIESSLTSECNNSNNELYFLPNYPFSNRITMANMFYAIRKMELKNNIYGFENGGNVLNNDGTIKKDNNNIDTHMIKNIEWQAVALLSSSKYGISNNKIVNNNGSYTGNSTINEETYDYNVLDNGVKASTTGNIYGVYDMSGGKREFVMLDNEEINLFNKKSNSGFKTKVKEYYYDNNFNESDTTKFYQDRISKDNLINSEPITRGGYKNSGNIFNVYCAQDYINKISLETNSRASLVIIKER